MLIPSFLGQESSDSSGSDVDCRLCSRKRVFRTKDNDSVDIVYTIIVFLDKTSDPMEDRLYVFLDFLKPRGGVLCRYRISKLNVLKQDFFQ